MNGVHNNISRIVLKAVATTMPERLVLRPDMFLKVVDIVMLLFDEALYHIDMYLYHKKTVAIQLNQSADRRTID